MQLVSRNIFIDTRYFLSKSLDFNNKEILALEIAVKKGLVNVFLTDITEMEILKKIDDEITISYTKITSSDARYLKSIPLFSHFLTIYPLDKIREYFLNRYYNFKKQCKVSVISSDTVKVKNIFDDYCRLQPPFKSDASKNRKGEFPDAFALATINNWTKKTKKKTYILSGDSDWKMYSERTFVSFFDESDDLWLNPIDTLSGFLDLIIRNENDLENLTAFADSLVDSNSEIIQKQAKNILQKCKYQDDSIDIDTEIVNHYIISTLIDQKEIISVSRDSAVYNLEIKIELVLKYFTESYDGAVYDSEDGIYRNVKKFHSYRLFVTSEPLTIEINYEDGIPANFQIIYSDTPDPIFLNYDDGKDFVPNEWILNLPVLVCGVSQGKITENGSGCENFPNIKMAKEVYPELDPDKSSAQFTAAIGNRINEELRFETWKANEFYSMD
jgi:hypothetical protein